MYSTRSKFSSALLQGQDQFIDCMHATFQQQDILLAYSSRALFYITKTFDDPISIIYFSDMSKFKFASPNITFVTKAITTCDNKGIKTQTPCVDGKQLTFAFNKDSNHKNFAKILEDLTKAKDNIEAYQVCIVENHSVLTTCLDCVKLRKRVKI